MAERQFLKQLRCIILNPQCNYEPFQNELIRYYNFWESSWETIFNQSGKPIDKWKLDFYKSDRISVILSGNDVVSICLHSFYSLDSQVDRQSKYLSIFPEEVITHFKIKNLNKFMTQEYLIVSPQLRNSKGGACIGELAMALAVNLSVSENMDFTIGTPILTTTAINITKKLGGTLHPFTLCRFGYQLGVATYECNKGLINEIDIHIPICASPGALWRNRIDLTVPDEANLNEIKNYNFAV